jgi:hypothetical protein
MSESKRELLMQEVQRRLEAMLGDPNYSLGQTLESVQRIVYSSDDNVDSATSDYNQLSHLPTIILQSREHPIGSITLGLETSEVEVDIAVFLPKPHDETASNRAIADVRKAIAVGGDVAFGVGLSDFMGAESPFELRPGMYDGGFHYIFTGQFQEQIGAPGLEE